MKTATVVISVLAGGCAFAQLIEPGTPRKTQAYYEYLSKDTSPRYGLAKIKRFIARSKRDDNDNRVITDAQFKSLTIPEKFTYTMINGEDYEQNCDPMPMIKGAERKIFAYTEGDEDGTGYSKRQLDFLHKNRLLVIKLIHETIGKNKRVGANLKGAINELDAWELIPDMLNAFTRDGRDLDILSECMLLMNEANYKPFTNSRTYDKLYGGDENHQSSEPASARNEKQILHWTKAFYALQIKHHRSVLLPRSRGQKR